MRQGGRQQCDVLVQQIHLHLNYKQIVIPESTNIKCHLSFKPPREEYELQLSGEYCIYLFN